MGDDKGSYYDDMGQEYNDDDYERYDVRHPNTEKDKSGYYGDEEDSYDLNDMDDNNKNNNSYYLKTKTNTVISLQTVFLLTLRQRNLVLSNFDIIFSIISSKQGIH